jgi:hypothetical protein
VLADDFHTAQLHGRGVTPYGWRAGGSSR